MKKIGFCLILLLIYQSISAQTKLHPILQQQIYFDTKAEEYLNNSEGYPSILLKSVLNNKLYLDPVWQSLVLYKSKMLGGLNSQVDGANFFLSRSGKTRPDKEMLATLSAFFETRNILPGKYSAQCTFPARYHWLKQKLSFDQNQLPEDPCTDLNKLRDIIQPDAITVVFPSTHPNSPSSMFGHTLLRFDSKKNSGESAMLNFSVNYAAEVAQNAGGLSYAVRGITGGFPGRFRFVPYYLKLREYAQMENRDLWEYTLNLSPEQVNFILYHAYELSGAKFDYYFFTENCSYHLLSLLDIAFGKEKLTDEFTGWTIPIDTVKSLEKRGLVAKVNFQPSLSRKINANFQRLSPQEKKLVTLAYRNGLPSRQKEIDELEADRQVQLYDLLSNLYRYKKLKNATGKVGSKLNQEERSVLLARSKLKFRSQPATPIIPDVRPDKGHGTARVSFNFLDIAGDNAIDMEWRPAYHDVTDPSAGYSQNTSVEFFTLKSRYRVDDEELQINHFTLLSILSLEPRHRFFSNYSWYVDVGWRRMTLANSPSYSFINGGGGLTYGLPGQSYFYALVDASLRSGEVYRKAYSALNGYRIGMVSEPFRGWRLQLESNFKKGWSGDRSIHTRHSIQQTIQLTRNTALKISASREYLFGDSYDQYTVGMAYYY